MATHYIEMAYEVPLFERRIVYRMNNVKVKDLGLSFQRQTAVFHKMSLQ